MRPLSLDAAASASAPQASGRALTAEQELAASRRGGSMLLAAAAGSGKTSVLVERYVRAVLDDGVDSARILAITFTERAAFELKERIRARLRDLGRRALARETEAASIGTIHGFCARLLRADPLAVGLAPSFAILEEATAARMRAAAFTDALGVAMLGAEPGILDASAAYGPDRLRQIVGAAYSELRSRGQSTPALPALPDGGPHEAIAAYALLGELLGRYGEAYAERKRSLGAVDFDDLELLALQLLAQPSLRTRWMERFDMLMVDEFQDTNRRQTALLSAIEGENLFTVGDEWQAIYGFRHADVEIFRRREDELADSGASLALTRNFRSRPGIIDAVNAAFGARFGERFNPLSAARDHLSAGEPAVEVLITDTHGWDAKEPGRTSAPAGLAQAPAWRMAEACLIARRVSALVADGRARPGEVAVLLRSMSDLPLYEGALRAVGLPTWSVSADLWEARETKDILCGLRALANPLDELALYGVLAGPLVRLSTAALWQLSLAGREGSRGLWEAMCEGIDRPGGLPQLEPADRLYLQGFRERFGEDRRRAGERTLASLVRSASPSCHRVELVVEGSPEAAGVRCLMQLASDFEALEGRDLRGLIEHLDHLAQTRSPVGGQGARGEIEAVQLMSIHAAKGLEFPVVCVADLGRSAHGREAPYLLVDDDRVGLRVARLDGGAPEPAFHYEELARARALAEEQEEDRILYVAMTRAREMLLLSGAASFERWPKDTPGCAPIAWIAPALVEDLQERIAGRAGQRLASQTQPACILSTPGGSGLVMPEPLARERIVTQGVAVAGRFSAGAGDPSRAAAPSSPELLVGETLSYTALSELERCGYRYYLERVLRLPQSSPPAAGSAPSRPGGVRRGGADRARTVGDLAHHLMQRFDFSRGRDPGVEEVLRAAVEMDAQIGDGASSEILGMLGGLRASSLGGRLAAARMVRTEQPFSFALHGEEGSIAGVFDAIATERDGSCLVIDYKTGAVSAQEDLSALVAADYELQRLTYALAALRDGALAVEVVHWYLRRPEDPVSARFDASELGDLEARMAERVGAARRRGFAVSATPNRRLCSACPGRGGLCSWPLDTTMG